MAPSSSFAYSMCKLAIILTLISAFVPLARSAKDGDHKKNQIVSDGSIGKLRNAVGTFEQTESLGMADVYIDNALVPDRVTKNLDEKGENLSRRLKKYKRRGRKGNRKPTKKPRKMMKQPMMRPVTKAPRMIPAQCAPKEPVSDCSPDPLTFHESIGMQVELVGKVPTTTTEAFAYNMMVLDNFDDTLYFMNQKEGIIYSYDDTSKTVTEIFNIATSEIPAGLTLDFVTDVAGSGQMSRVHAMSQGGASNEVYVVFSSTTLPAGYTEAQAKLPPAGTFPGYVCEPTTTDNITTGPFFVRDLYRIGPDSGACVRSILIYNVFYKYTVQADGSLANPVPFFALEQQLGPTHLGGGMITLDDGRVLWSVGDCIPYGSDGRFAPQLDWEHCGKILMINPNDSTYETVAKGVRNSQQFRITKFKGKKDIFVFMDIGGVTAEEVNAIPLSEITDTTKIENFGWGRNLMDGKTREGSFYVGPGTMGVLGTEPPCEGKAPAIEEGFLKPWIQFGRSADDFFYGISSFSVAMESFTSLKLIWTEYNTGLIMGTDESWRCPSDAFKIKVYDIDGTYLETGLNQLVQAELGEVGYYRGDPRMFHFPDGTAGVFIERTGAFYKLTEIAI